MSTQALRLNNYLVVEKNPVQFSLIIPYHDHIPIEKCITDYQNITSIDDGTEESDCQGIDIEKDYYDSNPKTSPECIAVLEPSDIESTSANAVDAINPDIITPYKSGNFFAMKLAVCSTLRKIGFFQKSIQQC